MSPYYKGMKVNLLGFPVSNSNKSDRVKKNGRKRKFYHLSFSSPFPENAPKNLLLVYDIPELMKKERDWFRRQLISFGFVMIQKSVWVGPSPLPKEFLNYLKLIKKGDNFKTFKLAKGYETKK
ncbi:MAG TPA: CRISPR-associated endonuclease Cas2 [Candidatus Paceibacterota bacterium]|nr:CRISPR-associated endonuclease Cas2 [Candidatus Paceibacterota bacterium]HPT18301.1 CRISPR-associated endonuclease Cas2 [Candidatus Paceibacterota bacterium]